MLSRSGAQRIPEDNGWARQGSGTGEEQVGTGEGLVGTGEGLGTGIHKGACPSRSLGHKEMHDEWAAGGD